MVKGKDKGNKWELEVLRDLKKIDNMAHRSIGSGNAKDESGDIFFGPYMIECKHHKKIGATQVRRWWKKIAAESFGTDFEPLLVMKENWREPLVCYKEGDLYTFHYYKDWMRWLKDDEREVCIP